MSPAASTDKPLAKTVATPNPFAPTGPSSAHAASEQELETVSGQFDGGSAPSPQEPIRPLSPNISPFEETLPYSAQAPMNLAPSDATQEAQNTRDDFPAFDIDEGLSDEPLSTSDSPPGEHSSPASSTHGNVEHGHPQSNDPHASLSAQEHSHHLVETAAPPLAGQPTIQNQVTPPFSQQPEETHELQAEPPPGDTVDELDIDFDIVSQEGAPISAADRISVPAASHEAEGGSPLEQQDQTESAPSGIGHQAQTVSKLTQSALATEVNAGPQPRPLPGRSDHLLAEAADNAFSETDAHEPFTVERFMVPTIHTEEIDIDLQSLVSGEAQTSEVEINVTSVVTSEEAESSLLPGESVSDFGDFMDALENQMRPFLSLNNIADIEHSKAPLGLDSKGHPLIHLMEAFLSKKQESSVDSQAELRNVVSLRTEGRAQQRLLDSMNALDVEQLKALSRVDDPYVLQEQLYKPSSEPALTSIEDEDEAQTITHEIEIGTKVPVPTAAEESATDHQNGPEPASQEAQSNTPTEEGHAPTPPANGNTSETLAESWRNAAEGQLIQRNRTRITYKFLSCDCGSRKPSPSQLTMWNLNIQKHSFPISRVRNPSFLLANLLGLGIIRCLHHSLKRPTSMPNGSERRIPNRSSHQTSKRRQKNITTVRPLKHRLSWSSPLPQKHLLWKQPFKTQPLFPQMTIRPQENLRATLLFHWFKPRKPNLNLMMKQDQTQSNQRQVQLTL